MCSSSVARSAMVVDDEGASTLSHQQVASVESSMSMSSVDAVVIPPSAEETVEQSETEATTSSNHTDASDKENFELFKAKLATKDVPESSSVVLSGINTDETSETEVVTKKTDSKQNVGVVNSVATDKVQLNKGDSQKVPVIPRTGPKRRSGRFSKLKKILSRRGFAGKTEANRGMVVEQKSDTDLDSQGTALTAEEAAIDKPSETDLSLENGSDKVASLNDFSGVVSLEDDENEAPALSEGTSLKAEISHVVSSMDDTEVSSITEESVVYPPFFYRDGSPIPADEPRQEDATQVISNRTKDIALVGGQQRHQQRQQPKQQEQRQQEEPESSFLKNRLSKTSAWVGGASITTAAVLAAAGTTLIDKEAIKATLKRLQSEDFALNNPLCDGLDNAWQAVVALAAAKRDGTKQRVIEGEQASSSKSTAIVGANNINFGTTRLSEFNRNMSLERIKTALQVITVPRCALNTARLPDIDVDAIRENVGKKCKEALIMAELVDEDNVVVRTTKKRRVIRKKVVATQDTENIDQKSCDVGQAWKEAMIMAQLTDEESVYEDDEEAVTDKSMPEVDVVAGGTKATEASVSSTSVENSEQSEHGAEEEEATTKGEITIVHGIGRHGVELEQLTTSTVATDSMSSDECMSSLKRPTSRSTAATSTIGLSKSSTSSIKNTESSSKSTRTAMNRSTRLANLRKKFMRRKAEF